MIRFHSHIFIQIIFNTLYIRQEQKWRWYNNLHQRRYSQQNSNKHCFPKDIDALFIELNFRKYKWLLCGLFHLPSQKDQYFFDNVDKALDVYSTYEKAVLGGDFDSQIGENFIDNFMCLHNLQSVSKELSCYKNPNELRLQKRRTKLFLKIVQFQKK